MLPFVGGHLCDVFGAARCLVVFAILLTAGQALFAFGVSVSSVPVLLLGRVVFGLGGENMTVALSTLLAEWFRGKEMAFAMGLLVALTRRTRPRTIPAALLRVAGLGSPERP